MVFTLYGVWLPTVLSVPKVGSNGSRLYAIRRNAHVNFVFKSHSHSWKIFAGKSSDSLFQSSTATASDKVLVPGTENEETLFSAEESEVAEIASDDSQMSGDVESSEMGHGTKFDAQDNDIIEQSGSEAIAGEVSASDVETTSSASYESINGGDVESSELDGLNVDASDHAFDQSHGEAIIGNDSTSVALLDGDAQVEVEKFSAVLYETISDESKRVRNQVVPPPGIGQNIYEIDSTLSNYRGHLDYRYEQYKRTREEIDKYEGGLEQFSRGHEMFGFTRSETGVTYREWAPGAKSATLIGDFNDWNPEAGLMSCNEFGVWEIFLPNGADGSPAILHGSRVKIRMETPSGIKDSIPAWIKFSIQAPREIPYNGIYYDPPEEEKFIFTHPRPKKPKSLRIYESHIGMSSKEPVINTYANFRDEVLPRIKRLGYNAVQIMAIQEHSYYASFGYHVTNFFAPSSRFGTPEDLKSLIDKAHELGLVVLMDIVHSHASNNTLDGLNMFDGTDTCYFHSGARGYHWMWDSRLFNYGHWEVLRFLLSNARWWLDEYKFDGFRFDGVTSMMYTHHGLQVAFTGNYNEYFGFSTDVDAMVYLMLVNDLIHALFPEAITIGEDVSGMPTFCIPVQDGGVGFDYRLHMAVADKWIEILKKRDEDWQMGDIVYSLTNRRWKEKCIVYAESHDQALVGDKTIAFWLMDKDMYDFMALDRPSTPLIDRGLALHKMIRLITMGLGGEGYLNFMGNEFGHPEWIDFPRGEQSLPDGRIIPGNNYSYDKCRRRFDLGDADDLRYHGLQEFDQAMQHVEEKYGFMTSEHEYISRKDEGDKIIVFERRDLVFVFNFHWNSSYSDYRVGCLKEGKYKVVLDTDDPLFGGYSRISHEAEHFTSIKIGNEGDPQNHNSVSERRREREKEAHPENQAKRGSKEKKSRKKKGFQCKKVNRQRTKMQQTPRTLENQLSVTQSGPNSGNLSFSGTSAREDEEMSISALSTFRAKEEEIEKRKMEVKEKVQAQLGRIEEETRRLATIREELDGLADPMRKEISFVRKKIDAINKELKPLGQTCQKKEKEYKEALEAVNEKNKEKVQLITRLMELVGESEKLRMKKLEELNKNVETMNIA